MVTWQANFDVLASLENEKKADEGFNSSESK